MKKTKSERNWVVVIDNMVVDHKDHHLVYCGELDCGRQGVLNLKNATRFTRVGALRVLGGYPQAVANGRAYATRLPGNMK